MMKFLVMMLFPLCLMAETLPGIHFWNSMEYSFDAKVVDITTTVETRRVGTNWYDRRFSGGVSKDFGGWGVYTSIMGRFKDYSVVNGKEIEEGVDLDNRYTVGAFFKVTDEVKVKIYHETHFNRRELPQGEYMYGKRLRFQVTYYKDEGIAPYFYQDAAYIDSGLYRSRTRFGVSNLLLHLTIVYQHQIERLTPYVMHSADWVNVHAIMTIWKF